MTDLTMLGDEAILDADLAKEIIMQAHEQMHKKEFNKAHELLHKFLGVDNEVELPTSNLSHRLGFDRAFMTACRKNNVRAMYVLVDSVDDTGRARLMSGGDAELCEIVDNAFRSAIQDRAPK